MTSSTTLLLFVSLLVLLPAQLCPSSGTITNFVSDSLQIGLGSSNPIPRSSQAVRFSQTLVSAFQKIPTVATSLTGFQVSPGNDLSLLVRPLPATTTSVFFSVRAFCSVGHWVKISVGFLAAASSDIELGEAQINVLGLSGCCSANRSQPGTISTISNWNNRRGASVKVFLSGFQMEEEKRVVEIKLSNSTLTGSTIKFTIESKSHVKALQVSYVIFDSAVFKNSNAASSFQRTPLTTSGSIQISSGFQYLFYGLTAISGTCSSGLSFSVAVNLSSFTVSTQSGTAYILLNYIQFGPLVNLTNCQSCQGYTLTNGNQCVSKCPLKTQPIKRICTKCPENSIVDKNGVCLCLAPLVKINGTCGQCPKGTKYNSSNLSCDPVCPPNSVLNGTSCVCADKYVKNAQGNCMTCPVNSTYDCKTKSCSCAVNFTFDPTVFGCVCADKFVKDGKGNCVQCPIGATYNKNTCTCATNFTFNATAVTCDCIAPYLKNSSGNCVACANGTQYNATTKTCQPICPANSVVNSAGTACDCVVSYFKDSQGNCIQCASGTLYNSTSKTCVCPPNSSFDSTGTLCNCDYGFVKDSKGNCSPCPSNTTYNYFAGRCIINCPTGSGPDSTGTVCVCNPPYVKNSSGVCVLCGSTFQYDPVTNSCICPTSTALNAAGTACDCVPQYARNSLGFCAPCAAGTVYNTTTKACQLACPDHASLDSTGTVCTCTTPYILNTFNDPNTCDCPDGASPNSNGVCVCNNADQYLTSNGCQKCGVGYTYDSASGACKPTV